MRKMLVAALVLVATPVYAQEWPSGTSVDPCSVADSYWVGDLYVDNSGGEHYPILMYNRMQVGFIRTRGVPSYVDDIRTGHLLVHRNYLNEPATERRAIELAAANFFLCHFSIRQLVIVDGYPRSNTDPIGVIETIRLVNGAWQVTVNPAAVADARALREAARRPPPPPPVRSPQEIARDNAIARCIGVDTPACAAVLIRENIRLGRNQYRVITYPTVHSY